MSGDIKSKIEEMSLRMQEINKEIRNLNSNLTLLNHMREAIAIIIEKTENELKEKQNEQS